MTTYPNDVVEKALAAQHLVLDRGGSGADALRAALAAAEAAMWRPIDEHDGGVTPWLVEDGDGFVGEASYLPDYGPAGATLTTRSAARPHRPLAHDSALA